MTNSIKIIGSVDPDQAIAIEVIEQILSQQQTDTQHNTEFTGRPNTEIYANENYIIKLHQEYDFKQRDAVRWIEKTLAKEHQYQVHHPAKTWFLICGEKNIIANITPRLQALHQLELESDNPSELQTHFLAMVHLYLSFVAKHQMRLDDGLSNFAIDAQQKLYYVDDDVYPWDNFTAFAQAFGIYLRRYAWLDHHYMNLLGLKIALFCIDAFKDSHCIMILAEQLRGINTANQEQKDKVFSVIKALHAKRQNMPVSLELQQPYVALLADIHANLPALKVVLDYLEQKHISQGLVLGDVVGYGPHPNECIVTLKNTDFWIIKGNHDHGAATGKTAKGFSKTGKWVIDWTEKVLQDGHKKWLDKLPVYLQHDNWLAVHGAPCDKHFFMAYVYQMTYSNNLNNLAARAIKYCFHGHTHIPGIYYRYLAQDKFSNESKQNIANHAHNLICPGSIGQTRNKQFGTYFALWDREQDQIEFICLSYPVEQTVEAMQAYNFPPQLVDRLQQGI